MVDQRIRVPGCGPMLKVWQNRLLRHVAAVGIATASLAMGTAVQAESFKQALVNAYRSNPTLQAERARQRGTDELVPSAKSG